MEQNQLHPFVSIILPFFDTSEKIIDILQTQKPEEAHENLLMLKQIFCSMESSILALLPKIQYPNKLKDITMNMPLLVERLLAFSENGEHQEITWRFRCELRPMFIFWRRYFDFFMVQCIDDESMAEYNRAEAEKVRSIAMMPKQDTQKEYLYDLSIVVLFYDHEELTEQCIDALKKYTVGYSYEIITINNGSGDVATKWSETLKHQKKIHIPINIGSSSAGNMVISLAQEFIDGKYLLFVSNDVIATENYIKSLVECMESDSSIIMATPVTNSLSNMQAIPVPYEKNDLPAMQQFAAQYNTFDPKKWKERARLFPFFAICRPAEIARFEFGESPYFCYDMFSDDDFSIRYRRAGYKQILCSDVFVHHYGSATIGEEQGKVMNLGRRQFFNKYGIDAWSALEMRSMLFTSILQSIAASDTSILYFQPYFGEGALAIKNQLKENGCQSIIMDALTTDARYLEDMKTLFRYSALADQWSETEIFHNRYDWIFCEGNFEDSDYLSQYITIAAHCLKDHGVFGFIVKNVFGYDTIRNLLNCAELSPAWEKEAMLRPHVSYITMGMLTRTLQNAGLKILRQIGAREAYDESWAAGLLQAPAQIDKEELTEQLPTDFYIMLCRKEI